MHKKKKPRTYEDYAALPSDKRYELIWGEIVVVPSPDVPHQAISRELLEMLKSMGLGRV
jgi:Uma2 family endonuclease